MAANNNSWLQSALEKVSGNAGGGGGMKKAEQPNWKDTNVANIGSAEDKAARKAAAETEPCWAGAGTAEGVRIWRVHNKTRDFGIEDVEPKMYGTFFEGDSYIVLYTYKKDPKSPKLSWNIHFWLGSQTSQDEAGVAAYKTVELDDFLGTEPVQYRETQGHESQAFLALFPKGGLKVLEGGHATGFVHVVPTAAKPRLLEVDRDKKYVRVNTVPLVRASLHQGAVFILDAGEKIYVFEGEGSNAFERSKATELVEALEDERDGKAKRVDGFDDAAWGLLGGRGDVAPARPAKTVETKISMYELQGDCSWTALQAGTKLDPDHLKTKAARSEVYLIDNNNEIFVWIGEDVPASIRRAGILHAQSYLTAFNRPAYFPITAICQGGESDLFWMNFGTSDGQI